ncbi:MAG TPA: amidohydrolase [Firmicutes bacterium]|nr:amidohydrolase [Bacillota bacterium]
MGTTKSKYVIANAMLVGVGRNAGVIPRGYLVVDGRRIVEVGEGSPPADVGEDVMDLSGRMVIPGLINCHNHVAMSILRGVGTDLNLQRWLKEAIWPIEEHLTKDDVFWGALLSISEMALGGITAIADMYFYMEEVARAAAIVGVRAFLSQGLVGGNRSKWWHTFFATRALWRKWNGAAEGKIKVFLGPHAVYTCPPPWLRKATQLARRLNSPLQIHLSETAEEVEECYSKHGMSPIALYYHNDGKAIKTLAAHCVHLSSEDIELLRKFDEIHVVHCPWSNLYLGSGIAPVTELLEAGVSVCLGTDGPASSSMDMFETMRLAALLQKGKKQRADACTARQAFLMATVNGAAALGLDTGFLAPGLEADLVIVDLDRPSLQPMADPIAALVYEGSAELVRDVMIAGEWVVRDRRLVRLAEHTITLEQIQEQVRERHRRAVWERNT